MKKKKHINANDFKQGESPVPHFPQYFSFPQTFIRVSIKKFDY